MAQDWKSAANTKHHHQAGHLLKRDGDGKDYAAPVSSLLGAYNRPFAGPATFQQPGGRSAFEWGNRAAAAALPRGPLSETMTHYRLDNVANVNAGSEYDKVFTSPDGLAFTFAQQASYGLTYNPYAKAWTKVTPDVAQAKHHVLVPGGFVIGMDTWPSNPMTLTVSDLHEKNITGFEVSLSFGIRHILGAFYDQGEVVILYGANDQLYWAALELEYTSGPYLSISDSFVGRGVLASPEWGTSDRSSRLFRLASGEVLLAYTQGGSPGPHRVQYLRRNQQGTSWTGTDITTQTPIEARSHFAYSGDGDVLYFGAAASSASFSGSYVTRLTPDGEGGRWTEDMTPPPSASQTLPNGEILLLGDNYDDTNYIFNPYNETFRTISFPSSLSHFRPNPEATTLMQDGSVVVMGSDIELPSTIKPSAVVIETPYEVSERLATHPTFNNL